MTHPALEPRQIEQVADDVLEAIGLVVDDTEIAAARGVVERDIGHPQRLDITENRRERRRQLVRDVGQQLAPRAVRGLERLRALLQLAGHLIERPRAR